jgi:hypothetical protein
MIRTPLSANTSSDTVVNLLSRSRIRKLIPHRPAALHRHWHRRVPVYHCHRRGRQLSELIAQFE